MGIAVSAGSAEGSIQAGAARRFRAGLSGCTKAAPVRLLIVPGLHDSPQAHWQTELQRHHHRHAVRVQQEDWAVPSLDAWADRIGETLAREPRGPWVAVAHSFGCLALVRWLQRGGTGIESALLVAPADPLKFGVSGDLPCAPLPVATTLVASRTDPWMPFGSSVNWSRVWGSQLVDLGDAGHINIASGFGPWPLGKKLVERQIQAVNRRRRVEQDEGFGLELAAS
ncbi:alpha/beta fold hydrolase [soil metagenome]